MRQIFLMIPLFIFGANSGYLYCLYSENKDLQQALISISIIIGLIAALSVNFIINNNMAAIAVFLMILVISLEKVLIAREKMIIASIYKAIISLAMLSIATFLYYKNFKISALTLYSSSITIAITLWIILIISYLEMGLTGWRCTLNNIFSDFYYLVRKGFILSIQSYILLLYFIFDRHIVINYYNEFNAEYALAFTLSQVIFIAINTFTFTAQQKIGVRFVSFNLEDHNKILSTVFRLFIFLFLVGVVGVYLYSTFISGYGNFIGSFIIMSLLYGGYYSYSTMAIVGFYQGSALASLGVILFFFILNAAASILIIEFNPNYYINLIKSGALLLLSAWVYDLSIRKKYTVNG